MMKLLWCTALALCMVAFIAAPCTAVSERASPVGTAESSSAGKRLVSSLGGSVERTVVRPEHSHGQDAATGAGAGDTVGRDESAAGLRPNVPNPFNPATTVSYVLQDPSHVVLTVYDVSGRVVATLVDAPHSEAGVHSTLWSGKDNDGAPLPSGVYFLRLVTEQFEQTRKTVLLR